MLARTLALAAQAIGLSDPNPRVGCVIAPADGDLAGRDGAGWEGHTQQAGGPHAEIVALRAGQSAGVDLRGATAWVTLEPCAHHGRTPPCCDALIAAGLGRVVVALRDPNPLVAGQGIARMRAAGIEVQVADEFHGEFAARFAAAHPSDPQGLSWARAAFELNIGFFSRMVRGRPWVRMKVATSLDGRTALADGSSQWITSPAARADGHAWRQRAGAVLTGIGTVRDDNPRLDVREVPTARQPVRVVVDSRLEIDPSARILQPPGAVWVCCAQAHAASDKARALSRLVASGAILSILPRGDANAAANASLAPAPASTSDPATATAASRDRQSARRLDVAGPWGGVEVLGLPTDERGKTDLTALMSELAARGVNELHVEAGEQLNGSLLKAGLVDELLVYLAPKLLGPGRSLAAFGPLANLADAPAFEFLECTPIGPDLRLRARPPGRAGFWDWA